MAEQHKAHQPTLDLHQHALDDPMQHRQHVGGHLRSSQYTTVLQTPSMQKNLQQIHLEYCAKGETKYIRIKHARYQPTSETIYFPTPKAGKSMQATRKPTSTSSTLCSTRGNTQSSQPFPAKFALKASRLSASSSRSVCREHNRPTQGQRQRTNFELTTAPQKIWASVQPRLPNLLCPVGPPESPKINELLCDNYLHRVQHFPV